jgi:DNA-binding NarL/FixJ family response regulator
VKTAVPTIVIADDHQITRVGVRAALLEGGFDVVGEAGDAEGAVREVLSTKPAVCLLDIYMPGGGLDAARQIAADAPATSIVMLTVSDRTEDVLGALRAGAVGYLPKDTRPDRLPAALCGVLKGEAALPRTLVGRVLDEFRTLTVSVDDPVRVGEVELSPRESEVLRLLRAGSTTVQIGQVLSLSPITVRRHISASVAKLGVADRDSALRAIEARSAA